MGNTEILVKRKGEYSRWNYTTTSDVYFGIEERVGATGVETRLDPEALVKREIRQRRYYEFFDLDRYAEVAQNLFGKNGRIRERIENSEEIIASSSYVLERRLDGSSPIDLNEEFKYEGVNDVLEILSTAAAMLPPTELVSKIRGWKENWNEDNKLEVYRALARISTSWEYINHPLARGITSEEAKALEMGMTHLRHLQTTWDNRCVLGGATE